MLATLAPLLQRLPSAFLALVILQGAGLAGLAWFVSAEGRHREAVYAPLLASCLRVLER